MSSAGGAIEGAGDAPDGGGGGSIHPADTHPDDDGDDVGKVRGKVPANGLREERV